MIGRLLGNRYEVLEQLGGGGMAVIYKARDTFLNRLVTIKVLRPEFTGDEDFVERFRREAQAVARLSHPNIVSIYDVGREGDIHYLVMEFVEGENLKNLIKREGRLGLRLSAEIAGQVAEALQHAHENNIVHRDVKPQNIMITRSGRAKLTDFGIAREATAATLTQSDTIVGSVHYLSPEQARGETAGPASDIYSLGVVLYEMVTGIQPFGGDTPIGVALKHITETPAPPSGFNREVSPEMESIILRAMAKSPKDRYRSAGEMAADLYRAARTNEGGFWAGPADDFPTQVLPAARPDFEGGERPVEKSVAKKGRRMWFWVLLAVLAVLTAGALALHVYINVPEVDMPDVEGETLDEAREILKGYGIKHIQVSRNAHPSVPAGRVISQDPPPGTRVKVTRNVVLNVSQGPEYRVVPGVVGSTLNAARIELSKNDLNLAAAKEDYHESYPEGVVYDQEPKAGVKIAKGSGVILYVSKGPAPKMSTVPALVGLILDRARTELEKAGLKLDDNVVKIASTEYLAGQVVSQNPAAGTEVPQGTAVQVTVSTGPGPVRRLARVEARIPDDKKEHELKIVVKDVQGTNEVYTGIHSAGERVVRDVPYYGKAQVQVYIDKKLAGEQSFE